MDYELVKRLKDVGFPFNRGDADSYMVLTEHGATDEHSARENGYDFAYIPTFSELIEACGNSREDKRFVLWFDGELWHAGYFIYGDENYIDDYPSPSEDGKTREEAVANLWLKLRE